MKRRALGVLLTICMLLTLLPTPVFAVAGSSTSGTIQLGDYVRLGRYNNEDILWRCVAFEKATRQTDRSLLIDSTTTLPTYQAVGGSENDTGYLPLMVADQILCNKQFDIHGNVTTGSHGRGSIRKTSGSNYWGDSNLREWLNGDYASGDHAQASKWPCGNLPYYPNEKGFLKNFSNTEKAAIKEVTQKAILCDADRNIDGVSGSELYSYNSNIVGVVQNYSTAYSKQFTDTMFLLDVQQVKNLYDNFDDYYIRSKKYWLRTPASDSSSKVRRVDTSGAVNSYQARDHDICVRPAFFLDAGYFFQNSDIWRVGNGSAGDPYRMNDGSVNDPYEIPDLATLEAFRDKVNAGDTFAGKNVVLTADIVMNTGVLKEDGTLADDTTGFTPWTPIGSSSNSFQGIFDGGNHTVSGLYCKVESSSYDSVAGLFGFLGADGKIQNVGVTDSYFSNASHVGGVCAASYGDMENCWSESTVEGLTTMSSVGGVCGTNMGGSIKGCYNTGTVLLTTEMAFAGGVCGLSGPDADNATDAVLENCYNTGSVSAIGSYLFAGGVCGLNGDLYAPDDEEPTFFAAIRNCYNTGTVSVEGDEPAAGGVCGSQVPGGTSANCYYFTGGTEQGGIGIDMSGDGTAETVMEKGLEEFAGGEVAWLLQSGQTGNPAPQVWGQTLSGEGGNVSPVLSAKPEKAVYQVTFMNGETAHVTVYSNPSGVGEGRMPAAPAPANDTVVFYRWSQTNDTSGTEFTDSTAITGDTTVYAVWREKFGQTGDEQTVTTTYGVEKTQDLSKYMTYAGRTTETAGKFEYEITNGNDGGYFTVNGDTLTVSDNTPADTYELTITATEKAPRLSLLSTRTLSYGTEPVTLTVTVAVSPKPISGVTIKPIDDQTYTGSPIIPAMTVQDGGKTLTRNTDYTVSDDNNTNAGSATVTVKGINNYTGEKIAGFEILKAGQAAPNVTVNYITETLSTTTAMEWSTDGNSWETCDVNMAVTRFGWDGSAEITVLFRMKGDSNHNDGEARSVTILARPSEPSGITAVGETSARNDGRIIGLTDGAEYQISNDDGVTWEDAMLTGTEITGLAPGNYQVRFKATDTEFASKAVTVTVKAYQAPYVPVTPDPDEPAWENPFVDVKESDWFYESVQYACGNSLFYGTSDTTFSPHGDMTRGMLVTVLYRLAKEPGAISGNIFNDVADGKYYTEAIAWAAENSIVAGYGNNRFGPDDPITREQLTAILWRYVGSPESTGSLDSFTDGKKASNYAVFALQWAVEQKIVSGKGNGILDPRGKATRAEVATMLMRYCETEQ